MDLRLALRFLLEFLLGCLVFGVCVALLGVFTITYEYHIYALYLVSGILGVSIFREIGRDILKGYDL